jgi:hypothetical protein
MGAFMHLIAASVGGVIVYTGSLLIMWAMAGHSHGAECAGPWTSYGKQRAICCGEVIDKFAKPA